MRTLIGSAMWCCQLEARRAYAAFMAHTTCTGVDDYQQAVNTQNAVDFVGSSFKRLHVTPTFGNRGLSFMTFR